MSNLIPKGMSKADFVAILKDITRHVEEGDSFEGFIEYAIPLNDAGVDLLGKPIDFNVKGVYRIGNSRGQGGMRLIGEVPK